MSLQRLPTPRAAARWLAERCPGALRSDSRLVRPGDAFIAWPGASVDGRSFVASALAAGATACLVEADGAGAFALDQDRVACLDGLKSRAGEVADSWYRQPTSRLQVLAVTGTNGKTSTAWWLAQALQGCGLRCGVVGTLGVGEPPQVRDAGLTTPDAVALQAAFAEFVAQGCDACAIEASSIGLVEHRLAGTRIGVALFTNFTRDHLDYHGDMASYWAAKRSLFEWPGLRAAVLNVDDPQGAMLAPELESMAARTGLSVWTVSTRAPARLMASAVRYVEGGLAFDVEEAGRRAALRSGLIGDYNAHNLMVVLGGLRAIGIPLDQAVAAMRALEPVPGRMQRIPALAGQPEVVVDYAHTPDALQKVLESLAPLAAARGGALWCVFGCGGDRDQTKRPLMGGVAAERCDRVIVTSDNPRSEPPALIIEQIVSGVPRRLAHKFRSEPDRRMAIADAIASAADCDVLLIAGKGHEDYQDVAGRRLPFSDEHEAGVALLARAERRP